MKEYLESNFTRQNIQDICSSIAPNKRVLFYGAGNFSRELLKSFPELRSLNIIGFLDGSPDKEGQCIEGYKIYNPNKIQELSPDLIIISTINPLPIYERLMQLMFSKNYFVKVVQNIVTPLKINYKTDNPKKKLLNLSGYNCIGIDTGKILFNDIFNGKYLDICEVYPGYEQKFIDFKQFQTKLDEYWKNHDICEYEFLTYKNFNLFTITKRELLYELQRYNIELPKDQQFIKKHFSLCIYYFETYEKLLQEENPDSVLVSQGGNTSNRVLVELARLKGIQTIATENSFIKDLIFFDDTSGMICNRHSLARNSWDRIKARELSIENTKQLHDYFDNRLTLIPQKAKEGLTPEEIKTKLNIPQNKQIALFIGQVYLDSVMLLDSPVYKDPLELTIQTIKLLSKYQDYYLIIRLHPREYEAYSLTGDKINLPGINKTFNLLKEFGIDDYPHVRIIHDYSFNTYDLMNAANFAITICSQAGLEFLYTKKPLIVGGDAFYGKKGFTYDIPLKEAYPAILEKVINNTTLSKRQSMDIDKFLYHMIFEYLYPRDLIQAKDKLRKLFM
jgi:hypothetical protein